MWNIRNSVLITGALSLQGMSAVAQPDADYVLTNGRIYTVSESALWAEAVAIKGNEIAFVGSSEEAESFIGDTTKVSDLEGRMVMPGLIDTHLHVMLGAVARSGVWVAEIPTVDGVLEKVSAYADDNPDRDVIFGWGYGLGLFGPEGPSKELLDKAVPDRPAFLVREDGHSGWANSKALELAGIDENTPDPAPPAGVFGRDGDGKPTGAVNGGPANLWTLKRLPGAISGAGLEQSATPLLNHITELGITSIFDAGAPIATETAFQFLVDLDQQGKLPIRYSASYYINSASEAEGAIERLKQLNQQYKAPNFWVETLKITTDGVVENRKAAMLAPYNDGTGSGSLNFSPEVISELSVEAARGGFDVYMHTLGDRAVRAGLDAAEAVRGAGFDDTVVTLSHCQIIHIDDVPRFGETRVFINSTGGWMTRGPLEEQVLGHRIEMEYPFRPMFDTGVLFVNSSDFPATPYIDPFTHLEVSMTRRPPGADISERPKNPDSALNLTEAIEAYTINGARLIGIDDLTGTLEVGKRADLIVLDRNITEIDANQIHETQVLMTMMDGQVRHDFLFGWGDSADQPDIRFSAGFGGIQPHN